MADRKAGNTANITGFYFLNISGEFIFHDIDLNS